MDERETSTSAAATDLLAAERLERLKAAGAAASELAMAQRLRSQVIQSIRLADEESSIKVRDNMEDAFSRYAAKLEELEAKYAAPPAEESEYLTRSEALRWLRDQGLEIGKTKFYDAIGKPGAPRLLEGKRLARWEVVEYLRRQQLEGATVTGGVYDSDELVRRKLLADTEKAEADAGIASVKRRNLERESDRAWMPRVEAYATIAALVGRIRETALHHFRHHQIELCMAARGDAEYAPELYEAMARVYAQALNEVADKPLEEATDAAGEPAD